MKNLWKSEALVCSWKLRHTLSDSSFYGHPREESKVYLENTKITQTTTRAQAYMKGGREASAENQTDPFGLGEKQSSYLKTAI